MIAVVTGGSSGIGLETTRALQQRRYEVIVLDRVPSPLGLRTIMVDLADPDSIRAAVSELPSRIDVLCNVAGVAGTAGARTALAVNFFGARTLLDLVAERIATGGSIVNVASTAGWHWRDHLDEITTLISAADVDDALVQLKLQPDDGYVAYNRAKEAVVVWTVLAARQYAGRFRVNSVSPGLIQTPLLASFYESMGAEELDPLVALSGRAGEPAEIADIIAYLSSNEARWINGTDIVADFGAEAYLAIADAAPKLAAQAQVGNHTREGNRQ